MEILDKKVVAHLMSKCHQLDHVIPCHVHHGHYGSNGVCVVQLVVEVQDHDQEVVRIQI